MQSPGCDELADKEPSRDLTEWGAALNLLKFIIGLGIISLPEASKHVGWLASIVGLGIIAFVTVWGIFFALQSRIKLEKKEEDARDEGSARAMSEGEPLMRHSARWQDLPDSGCGFFDRIVGKVFGAPAQYLFAVCVALGQFTTLVIYIIVITTNLKSYFPETYAGLPVLISTVFVLGLFSLIPTLQGVAVLSAAGLSIYTFLFVGLLVELFNKAQLGTLPTTYAVKQPDASSLGQWFGISCFAFSGLPISTVMYEDMQNPRAFYKIVCYVFSACWAIYSAFAVLGYSCFGDDAKTLVYFNFAEGSVFRNGSSAVLASILCLSFVVQAVPLFRCATSFWHLSCIGDLIGIKGSPMPLIRWTILAATVVVAHFVPSVRTLMNTIGAISGVAVGFIFPALTYFKLSSRDERLSHFRCLLLVVIGVVGAIYSCIASVERRNVGNALFGQILVK